MGKPTRIQCCSTRHPKWCKTGATWSTIIQKHYIHQYLRVYFYQLTVITEFTHSNSTRKSKHITDHFNLELAWERFRISFFWTGFRLDLVQWSTIWPLRFPNRLCCIYWLLDSFYNIWKNNNGHWEATTQVVSIVEMVKVLFLQRPWLYNLSSTCTLVTLLRLRIRRITMINLCLAVLNMQQILWTRIRRNSQT